MPNDALVDALQKIRQEHGQEQNKVEEHMDSLRQQLKKKQLKLESLERQEHDATDEAKRVVQELEVLRDYYNKNGNPQVLLDRINRLQAEQSQTEQARQRASQLTRDESNKVQETQRAIQEHLDKLNGLAEKQKEITVHINKAMEQK